MATSTNAAFSPSVIKHAKRAFEGQEPSIDGFDTFMKHLVDAGTSEALPITVDTSHPISHYFISSSHNTYLSGNQLWSKSSTVAYKDVLKRGCRCIEIDVWDGDSSQSPTSSDNEGGEKHRGLVRRGLHKLHLKEKPNTEAEVKAVDSPAGDSTLMPTPWRTLSHRTEPRVLHGYTATKEVPFRKVCEVIRDYAFRASELPLIMSLEVHCSMPQQELMVEIMVDYWKPFFVPMSNDFSDETPLPTLESLRKRILIKVKYSPPERAAQQKVPSVRRARALSEVSAEKGSDSDETHVEKQGKKGKICEALGRLGVYTRSCHFHSLDQPEAKIPTHIFALSESKLLTLHEEQRKALFRHNASFLMRAYPKGTRVTSSNLDPTSFWSQGVQLVALNWQNLSQSAMMLNDAMFTGTCGWVLKPTGYYDVSKTQVKRQKIDLAVSLLAAQHLDASKSVTPDVYVKCELHVGSETEKEQEQSTKEATPKESKRKLRSSVRHSHDPDFGGEVMSFEGVEAVVPELSFVRIKVMDDISYQKDRILGWACFRLDRLPQGLRLLPLKGVDAKPNGSALLVDCSISLSD